MEAAAPIPPQQRDPFLRDVASELAKYVGPGSSCSASTSIRPAFAATVAASIADAAQAAPRGTTAFPRLPPNRTIPLADIEPIQSVVLHFVQWRC